MFWSGNYIAVREVNSLLKEENITLTQILEADDILQECKADKPALVQYLTSPEVLEELITLITEEPSKDLELQMQYQHASMACEVLTSHMSTMSDRLSSNFHQMNRLCDFINKEPPLNPLLASFFSKTVEMLLERSAKQDCYLYHIVCLRALDFFKARQDFLPNLLRHISTSAIMDTFKYFMRLEQGFDKVILSWLEEHQFLESLVQIACGSYANAHSPSIESGETVSDPEGENKKSCKVMEDESDRRRAERVRAVGAANAANLLCEIILSGCSDDGCTARSNVAAELASQLKSADGVALVLRGMFTSPADFRRHALVNGCQILLALLRDDPILGGQQSADELRSAVELVVAPHLPLLHQALLHEPEPAPHPPYAQNGGDGGGGGGGGGGAVGAARLQVATLMAQLAVSEVQEVAGTLVTLGTPATLLDMFFRFPGNNFLHAQVYALVKAALANAPHRTLYARHLLVECDLLTRLMDVFDEDEAKRAEGGARSGYMGFALLMADWVQQALETDGALAAPLDARPDLLCRWDHFCATDLKAALAHHDTALGGYYPPENVYEFNDVAADGVEPLQDLNGDDIGEVSDAAESCARADGDDGLSYDSPLSMETARRNFMDLIDERFDHNMVSMWEDYEVSNDDGAVADPEEDTQHSLAHQVLAEVSPWETPSEEPKGACTEGWADFGGNGFGDADPFASSVPSATAADSDYSFWNFEANANGQSNTGLENASSQELELANNLLNAMSIMTPEAVRSIMDTSAPAVLPHLPEPAPEPASAGEITSDAAVDASGASVVVAVSTPFRVTSHEAAIEMDPSTNTVITSTSNSTSTFAADSGDSVSCDSVSNTITSKAISETEEKDPTTNALANDSAATITRTETEPTTTQTESASAASAPEKDVAIAQTEDTGVIRKAENDPTPASDSGPAER